MKVWMIWIQSSDGDVWLSDAWDDDTTSENESGWHEAVEKAERDAKATGGTIRIQAVSVPGVIELFKIPEATAVPIP